MLLGIHRMLNGVQVSIIDAKLKAKNELALAMKPFLFAAFHVPSLSLTTSDGNEVKNFSKPVSAE